MGYAPVDSPPLLSWNNIPGLHFLLCGQWLFIAWLFHTFQNTMKHKRNMEACPHVFKTCFHSLTLSIQHYHNISRFKIHSLHVGSCDNHPIIKQSNKNQTLPYTTAFSELAANITTQPFCMT